MRLLISGSRVQAPCGRSLFFNLTKKVCFQAQAGAYFTSFFHSCEIVDFTKFEIKIFFLQDLFILGTTLQKSCFPPNFQSNFMSTEFRGVKKGVELQQNSIKLFILNWTVVFYIDLVIIKI